jgi:hypothetical protein
MDAILQLIIDRLNVCLARPLVRNSDGMVKCQVVWELPPAGTGPAGTPHECSELPFLRVPGDDEAKLTRAGGKRCLVEQLPVKDHAVVSSPASPNGWYYDTFSKAVTDSCAKRGQPQRVAFTGAATPPIGVTVSLQCLDEAQRYKSNRGDVDPAREHAEIGDTCEELKNGATSHDAMCWVQLADPTGGAQHDGIDRSMFCHPASNVCVRACASHGDCPPAWVCDDRTTTRASTASTLRDPADHSRDAGSAICVNPTCAVGE